MGTKIPGEGSLQKWLNAITPQAAPARTSASAGEMVANGTTRKRNVKSARVGATGGCLKAKMSVKTRTRTKTMTTTKTRMRTITTTKMTMKTRKRTQTTSLAQTMSATLLMSTPTPTPTGSER